MPNWIDEECMSSFQKLCLNIVKMGRVPTHVAVILDGNRRFARKSGIPISVGHRLGFDRLSQFCKWCIELGIPEVTAFAFSIENFQRTTEEVDDILELVKKKLYFDENDVDYMNRIGVRVKITGRMSLMPEDLQRCMSHAGLITRHNKKLTINIACAYTGRDEISRAATHILRGIQDKDLSVDDVDPHFISLAMDVGEPDLLIRTSGAVRLSHFLQWQVTDSVLYFSKVLWPEFTIWHFLKAILHYQRHTAKEAPSKDNLKNNKVKFLNKLEEIRLQEMHDIFYENKDVKQCYVPNKY